MGIGKVTSREAVIAVVLCGFTAGFLALIAFDHRRIYLDIEDIKAALLIPAWTPAQQQGQQESWSQQSSPQYLASSAGEPGKY